MKIGLLGGTFDPPHLGHLHMAELALESGEVDLVMWVPTLIYHSYKKPEQWVDRYFMCYEMIKKRDGMVMSDIELNANDAQMTEDVLKRLSKWNDRHSFRMILGADIYWERDKWSNFPLINKLAPSLWISRPGAKPLPVPYLEGNMNISSSEIRNKLNLEKYTNEDLEFLHERLDPNVVKYILTNGLYQ